ncbi:MAG: hypothetical protein ACYDD1_17025 [Caulobacteraceae bacterium]
MRKQLMLLMTAAVAMALAGCNDMMGGGNSTSSGANPPASASDNTSH